MKMTCELTPDTRGVKLSKNDDLTLDTRTSVPCQGVKNAHFDTLTPCRVGVKKGCQKGVYIYPFFDTPF